MAPPEPSLPAVPQEAAAPHEAACAAARPEELARRLERLAREGDAQLGRLGAVDAVVVAVTFVALPLLALWWAG